MFVVRHEYGLFFEHAMSRVNNPPDDSYWARLFVAGQPGIGKSFSGYYILFRLLALGQSVFFVYSPTKVYYFASEGVQSTTEVPEPFSTIVTALRNSWVLIDTEESDWVPPMIFNRARCVIWTSSPRESCIDRFLKKFGAEMWYMKAWSSKEIAASFMPSFGNCPS
ncbi:hypothetical protein B0H19DRAFT_115601 [Mycena capillaripes]|nr:hypothetical protein B0H19DRAFT_115601 [Mycena capillaripes]